MRRSLTLAKAAVLSGALLAAVVTPASSAWAAQSVSAVSWVEQADVVQAPDFDLLDRCRSRVFTEG